MRQVVADRPKPLAPVNGTPFLELLLNSLVHKGIREFVLLTGYKGEMIEDHFAAFGKSGVSVRYSPEETPLGTGGAVRHAARFATDPTLLVNGDTFFDADLASLFRFHRDSGADATLSLHRVEDISRYGSVLVDSHGVIDRFCEKDEAMAGPGLINAGVSLLSYDFIASLPSGQFSMERDIFPSLVRTGRLRGMPQEGAFFDIGTPESYASFQKFVSDHQDMFPAWQ